MSHRRRRGRWPFRPGHLVITLIAVTLAATAVVLFRQPAVSPDAGRTVPSAVRVVVAPVRLDDLERRVTAVGRVLPWQQVALAPEVSGRVQAVRVRLGDRVRAGELLLEIDPDPYREAVRERRAALLRAQARLEEASANLARAEALLERGAISAREHEAILAQQRAADADVEAAEAALARAERQLARCRLRAPFAGAVVERRVDPGAMVGPERPVLTLADLDTVAVEVGLTEQEVVHVKPGQRVVVESAGLPGRSFEGVVDGVADSSDPGTGTYTVRIRLENRDEPRLLGGMVVTVRIPWERLTAVPTLPEEALAGPEESPFVYVVRGGRAVRVPVEILARAGGRVAVAAGDPGEAGGDGDTQTGALRPGEPVVVVGQSLLTDGTEVELIQRGPEGGPP